jgi:hypothetical protein
MRLDALKQAWMLDLGRGAVLANDAADLQRSTAAAVGAAFTTIALLTSRLRDGPAELTRNQRKRGQMACPGPAGLGRGCRGARPCWREGALRGTAIGKALGAVSFSVAAAGTHVGNRPSRVATAAFGRALLLG